METITKDRIKTHIWNNAGLGYPVGQLDKPHCPSLKTADTNPTRVGRQPKQKPRTLAPARKRGKAGQYTKLKLYKRAEDDFLRAIPAFFEQLENTKVVFHNHDYVSSICDYYQPDAASLFLDWVRAFAILRSPYRKSSIAGVIQSDDNDFLTAFRLMKSQGIKPKIKHIDYHAMIWNIIQKHFPKQEFKGTDLVNKMIIQESKIHAILNDFTNTGKLTKTKKAGFTSYFYQVVQS